MSQHNFKYYHGTSSLFLNSIRTTGLGTINPNTDLKNLKVLKFLYNKVKEANLLDPKLSLWEETVIATIEQRNLKNNGILLNFSHDKMFASMSIERAVVYSCFNKWGSEVLNMCIRLYVLLQKNEIKIIIPESINLFKIESIISIIPQPILIEILDIDDKDLETELGTSASEQLSKTRNEFNNWSKKEKFKKTQFLNFKLLKPIPPQQLRFFLIDPSGYPSDPDFTFTLTELK